jgi:hypothetical protein
MPWKPSRQLFYVVLAVLALLLVAFYGLRWKFGQFAPDFIDKNVFNIVVVAALGVSIWNRRIWMEEKRGRGGTAGEDERSAAQLPGDDAQQIEGGGASARSHDDRSDADGGR